MQELQPKIKELNETNKTMAKAEGVNRQELSDIQTELGELSQRWSTLIQQNNEENKRYKLTKVILLLVFKPACKSDVAFRKFWYIFLGHFSTHLICWFQ